MKKSVSLIVVILIAITTIIYNNYTECYENNQTIYSDDITSVMHYTGESDYVIINNNEPNFLKEDLVTRSYEFYSDLDSLGRAGVTMASIGKDLMPKEERGEIGSIKPSGWHTIKYDFISGKYLYNRCHLIGYQLTGENANEKNLITCTRKANTGVMLEYENKVAKYIKETNNHVLYRVIPIFDNDNLVASGISMEAKSVEDDGAGIKFYIYIYNIQDGITIDYKTGESSPN